jgi:cell division protein FtsL
LTKPTWNKLFNVLGSRVKDLFVDKLSSQKLMVTSWRMILFVSGLAVFVIYSSHKVDQKVIRISKLNEELKDLRSRHIDMRTQLMSLSKTTKVAEEVEKYGLFESLDAPYKIQVHN